MRCNSFQKYVNKQKRKQMNKKEKDKDKKRQETNKKLWMRGGKILNNNFLNYSIIKNFQLFLQVLCVLPLRYVHSSVDLFRVLRERTIRILTTSTWVSCCQTQFLPNIIFSPC